MKRLFLALVMAIVFVLALTVAVSAESVHNGKVDLNQKVTLSDGTVLNLFDANGNALIWYKDSNSEIGYSSVRADSGAGEDGYTGGTVVFNQSYQFGVGNSTVGSVTAYEVNKLTITVNGSSFDDANIVVFNVMDDDVLTSKGNPFNCFRDIFSGNSNIEYAFLRLDTVALQASALYNCAKLKHVNHADITELRQIGGGSTFRDCKALFAGETVDLSNTKLCVIAGDGPFSYVPFKSLILPNTVTSLGNWGLQGTSMIEFTVPTGTGKIEGSQFNDSKSLTTIYINNTTTSISSRAFNNTALEKVFYVGTLEQLNALLDNTSTSSNDPFWAVVGENRANLISYAKYKKLEDKSGKYVVYDYSYCEAYNNGNHSFDPEKSNDCAGICGTCGEASLKANPIHNYVTTISYAKGYLNTGIKTETCQNAGCAHASGYESVVEAIATFNGISVKIKGDGLTFGFTINYKALDELVKITGKSVELGFVVGVKDFIEGEVYGNQNAVTASVLTWIVETEEEKNEVKYASADFVLCGAWDRMVDLDGDMTAETNVKDVEFYMAGYLATNNTVSYLNASDNFTSPDVVTYSGCNQ